MNIQNRNMKEIVFAKLMEVARKTVAAKCREESFEFGKIQYLDIEPYVEGRKETLVLLHGLGADKDTWLNIVKFWRNKYRIIALDLPGHGSSTKERNLGYSIQNQATRIIEFLQKLELESCHLIGHSMGGTIAAKIAYIEPSLVRSMTLMSCYGVPSQESEVEALEKQIGFNPMLEIKNMMEYKSMMKLAMFKRPYIPGFMISVLAEKAKENAELYKSILKQSESEFDLTKFLPDIDAPTLVVWGKEDKVLSVDGVDVLNNHLKNCEIYTIDRTGHVPAVERPKATATRIAEFIEKSMLNQHHVDI